MQTNVHIKTYKLRPSLGYIVADKLLFSRSEFYVAAYPLQPAIQNFKEHEPCDPGVQTLFQVPALAGKTDAQVDFTGGAQFLCQLKQAVPLPFNYGV